MRIRILLGDDHRMFREAVRTTLPREEFEIVAEASDGQEAVRLARRHQPDIALLDISMPSLNGVDAGREVLRASPRSRVVMLSMHKEDGYLLEALRAGARGYVLKNQGVDELVGALREVARGHVYLSAGLSRVLVESIQGGDEPDADPLSPREREVLQLVAEGMTTKEIGATLNISFKTAECHRQRIMAKLDIHATAGLVRYAIRNRMITA